MASRKPLPTEKKLLMKRTNLSSTVLDYYNKFGQNRELEKYLHIRRQNSSKSSSDGSLYNFERKNANTAAETERVRNSLQKLNVSEEEGAQFAEGNTPAEPTAGTSASLKDKSLGQSSASAGASEQIKIQKILKKKSKSKSYNVSMESNIEINMPPPPPSYSLPELVNKVDIVSADTPRPKPKQLQFQSCETQTVLPMPEEVIPSPTREKSIVQQVVAQVEDIVVKTTKPIDECIVETSPASSIASAKMRLEWDSMADVGYNRIIDFKSKSNSNLSTSEKDALTKFFARRGLNFDDNLVIIASPDDRTKLKKRKITKSAIEMRQKSDNESWHSLSRSARKSQQDEEQAISRSSRGHWKTALMKYQEKYGRIVAGDETLQPPSDSLQLSLPQGQSTPFAIDASSKSEIKDDPVVCERVEKSCQTSLSLPKSDRKHSVASVGIQIEIGDEKQQTIPAVEEVPVGKVEKSTQSSDPNMTSTESFEYVAVDVYNKTAASSPISDDADAANRSEHIPSIPIVVNEEAIIDQNENVDEKENVPPIEDKENIPPPKSYSRIEGEFASPEREKSSLGVAPLQSSSMDESLLPNELQRGIDLLNALIDSKKLDRDAKKKLTRKIVRRLMKASNMSEIVKLLQKHEDGDGGVSGISSASKSVASDQKTISGIATLNSSGSTASVEVVPEKPTGNAHQSAEKEEIIIDWLKPVTRSEIEKERRPKTTTIRMTMAETEGPVPTNIREFIEVEKQNHFKWIDQEIEHLRNLKILMGNMDPEKNQLGSSQSLPERKSASANRNLDGKLNVERPATSSTNSSSLISKSLVTEPGNHIDKLFVVRPATPGTNSDSFISKSLVTDHDNSVKNLCSYQPACSANESDRPRTSNSTSDENRRNFPKWNSHLNMQQLVKNRTKLQTPSSDESIQSYAKARHAEFNRNYAKAQGILYGNTGHIANVYEHPIYTKPYSSDDYSDCGNRGLRKNVPPKSGNNVNAYTSITGSAAFLSSNSVSIAVAANSTSNTTTHQYDTKTSAGVQTSDTLQRMQPIRMRKITPEPPKRADESTSTICVRKFTLNKQQQARPEPLAYVITFNERVKQHKAENGSSSGNGKPFDPDDIDNDEHFTLQQYLRLRKPEFYSIAEERRKCVSQMHYLRQERNQQRKKLLASYSTSSTLRVNMKRLLPPPPLAQTRIFTSKDITANTRRKYRKLPEIRQKKIAEKEDRIRKNHRKLANIFNKNLQRRVLKGKTDLSNSMTIT